MKHIAFLLLFATPTALQAGDLHEKPVPVDSTGIPSGWEITSAIYAPLMGLEGSVGLAGIGPIDVDSSFGDVLDVLDAGLSGAFEFRNGPWSILVDATWLKISDSANPLPATTFNFSQEQITGSLSLGYEFYQTESTSLQFVAGAAFNHLSLDLNLVVPPLPILSASGSQTWIDPYFGLSFRQRIGERWTLFANGLYGGFGVSSDEYWQAVAGVGYKLTEDTSLAIAYRVISVDYQQGGFVYDTETSGPNIGLIVRF